MQDALTKEEEQRFQELCSMAFNYARRDEDENLKIMIEAGLNPNLKTSRGDTLFTLASYNNSLKTARMLLAMGANVDEANDMGQTPLAGVCFKGYVEMAKLLVDSGADIDRKNSLGMTPYGFAVMFGHYDLAKFLLSKSKQNSLKKSALSVLKLLSKLKYKKPAKV